MPCDMMVTIEEVAISDTMTSPEHNSGIIITDLSNTPSFEEVYIPKRVPGQLVSIPLRLACGSTMWLYSKVPKSVLSIGKRDGS